MKLLYCGYDDEPHEYAEDWIFGGPSHTSPRPDPRWIPTIYQYHNAQLEPLHITQVPDCDEQAIDYFTNVATWGPTFQPVYITVKRPGDEKFVMLPVRYNSATDTASDTR